MIIKTIKVGYLETNCYLVASDKTKEAIVIDPGDDAEKIIDAIEADKLKPILIINTHAHPDHVGANLEISKRYNIAAAVGEKDYQLIKGWGNYFEEFSGMKIENLHLQKKLKDGDMIKVGELEFRVIETPGHSKGSICLLGEGVLFSGDTLFAGDTGRTDIPGGSNEEMASSIEKLMDLPPETKVYPGHGSPTTIMQEKSLYVPN